MEGNMPFEWMQSDVKKDYFKKSLERFEGSFRNYFEYFAKLYSNLQYEKKFAKKRIHDNIAWEFERSKIPKVAGEIDKIVDKIYAKKK
jgi:hypothetical protein